VDNERRGADRIVNGWMILLTGAVRTTHSALDHKLWSEIVNRALDLSLSTEKTIDRHVIYWLLI